jgi:hypothetical protein
LPSVRANLAERFLFNFRLSPEALQKYLPAPWLVPQVIEGYAVASFCLLDLRNITVAPLPTLAGLTSISSAPRYAVVSTRDPEARPAVFVTERQTNSAFGAWFTTLGFSAAHPYVETEILHEGTRTQLTVRSPEGELLFSATVDETPALDSALFADAAAFAAFIAQGITSYGLSRHGERLTMMDLHKQDALYRPLSVASVTGPLIEQWRADGAVLDSAFYTSGGRYEWSYHGLTY